jgi:hypothetical protein
VEFVKKNIKTKLGLLEGFYLSLKRKYYQKKIFLFSAISRPYPQPAGRESEEESWL